jgi:plastocyanin
VPIALKRASILLAASFVLLALSAPSAGAAAAKGELVSVSPAANGAKRMLYRIGPFEVIPGQNEIGNKLITEKPQVDGWITRMRPDLVYTNGRVPGVDVIHLHHGVWANLSRPNITSPDRPELFFAAGEEKTIGTLPKGYGYRYRASDTWVLNHMIHNLTPVPTEVYMVYEIDFVPDTSPAARGIRPVRPIWMDVENGENYPVFDVRKGSGSGGRYTYPTDAKNPYAGRGRRNEWVADRNGVLVATAGHLHPGGVHTDLYLRRPGARIRSAQCHRRPEGAARRACERNAPRGRGARAHLFRSKAKYFEPAGAVSWDVAMTGTRPDWRVKIRRGDVLSTTATYDSSRAAWWESMGIMVTYMAEGGPGRDPFNRRVDYPGRPTHGHLPENNNHGGDRSRLPNPMRLADGMTVGGPLDVLDFKFTLGDLSLAGAAGRPPVVRRGQSITFRNQDDPRAIYHSITSCKPPCNRTTGIAYPIADGPVQFESGTLGSAVPPTTGRLEWKTPRNLDRGTYTYFCRIHPFMRGAFRVK